MIRCLFMLGVEPITSMAPCELHARGAASVFLNGQLLGLHRRPHRLVQVIRCVCLLCVSVCVCACVDVGTHLLHLRLFCFLLFHFFTVVFAVP